MKHLKIKNIILYSFIVLIIGILSTSGVLFVLLGKLTVSHGQILVISDTSNSFKQVKLDTERLFSSTNLQSVKKSWERSIVAFEKQLKLLDKEKQKRFNDIWYICKKEIPAIKELLDQDVLSPQNLREKPLLMIKGEMFALKEKTKYYGTVVSLSQKIEYLLEYEELLYKDITKLLNKEKHSIDDQIKSILRYAMFLIPFISLLMVVIIFIMNKKILKIENKLLLSQDKLKNNFIKLKDAKRLLQDIIDSVPVSIFWKDVDGKYLGLNKTFLHNTEFESIEDILGKDDFAMPWKDTEAKNYMADDQEVIKSGNSKLQLEETLTQENGELIHVITSKVPLTNINNETIGVLGVFMDITETKNMHNELEFKDKLLSQQSKMAAMGEMLENIAHQWRQPLSFISTSASGIEVTKAHGVLDDEFLSKSINNILRSVEHMNQTIEDFKNYFKVDKKFQYFKLSDVIDKSLFLVQSKIENRSITVVKRLDDLEVYSLRNEFIQVIMNILNNAIDALEEIDREEKIILFESCEVENGVQLKIRDNANGISENIIDKVFDPYFTTKDEKKGTGIGLYMSKDMIEKHMHGSIQVSNVEYEYNKVKYQGAEFILSLPTNS